MKKIMKKILECISRLYARFQDWHEDRRMTKTALHRTHLEFESRRVIQLREYGGAMYISVNNMPILPVDSLDWDLPVALDVCRDAWVQWRMEEDYKI